MGIIKPKVKICCISSVEEAEMAIKYGASAVGLVGKMPSGPGIITDEKIAEIAAAVPASVDTFLLTSETRSSAIIAHHQKTKTSVIQLVDELQNRDYELLRKELAGIKIVQVIHVLDEKQVQEAVEISAFVDGLLLDSGNPNLEVKQLGGTGRIHDWALSRKIVEQVTIPVFLAGGLNAENVRDALETVHPYGIDLCSSVRTNGKLDEQKLERFFSEINNFYRN